MKTDEFYLQRCIQLADMAAQNGNAAVGALLVLNDVIVSEAEEAGKSKNDITCHAELEAIRFALKKITIHDLSQCVMYTTHEPCIMCAYAIRFYKIRKVIFRNYVPYLGGITSAMPLLATTLVPDSWSIAPEIVHLPDTVL